MKAKFILKGLIKSVPGIERIHSFHKHTGGATNSARYCYTIWLRHLSYAYKNGQTTMPKKIAELGPGDSLGIGLAALICGVEQYYAFDVITYFNTSVNLKVFDELVDLFKNKTPIPDNNEFRLVKPLLEDYGFPSHILTDDYLANVLNKDRLEKIRRSIETLGSSVSSESMITYQTNWAETSEIKTDSLDMILSQAVLEHVEDVVLAYKTMHKWLKPNGIISHDIDFKSHGTAGAWYGHWEYSDFEWKVIKGRKTFLLNREPYSAHIRLLKENNFKVLSDWKTTTDIAAKRNRLAKRFKNHTSEDLITQTVFIQARK